jgi:aspartate kinase
MVVQDVGQAGRAEVSFTVPQDDLADTLTAAQQAIEELGAGRVQHGTNVSKISVVGLGMRTHTGVAAQMFRSLADAGINIGMITTSEIKISALVSRDQCDAAALAVHAGFGLHAAHAPVPSVGRSQSGHSAAKPHAGPDLEREIVAQLASMEDIVVSEVCLDTAQARVTLRTLPDLPGIAADVFSAVAEGGVMVDMIVQNVSHSGRASLSFTVPRPDLEQCLLLLRELMESWPDAELSFDEDMAKLSVVGIGLRTHTGVGEKMFRALAEAGINVQLINTSEIRICAVVAGQRGPAALDRLNREFGR